MTVAVGYGEYNGQKTGERHENGRPQADVDHAAFQKIDQGTHGGIVFGEPCKVRGDRVPGHVPSAVEEIHRHRMGNLEARPLSEALITNNGVEEKGVHVGTEQARTTLTYSHIARLFQYFTQGGIKSAVVLRKVV